ncbi:Holliday junction branch migration protein RuvA [Patescibacteria group bacterium]|nr:Holliday junction branch migration protein RuvA [Patescibacteria group bacterium]
MIRSVQGTLIDIRVGQVVIDIGGLGYLVFLPSGVTSDLQIGTRAIFHTYLAVREDSLTLYGFVTRDDLEMFEHLINLPKIGPKSALQILSQAPIELIKKAVASGDPEHLSKLSGMGKKTAEKIVIGLKDLFGDATHFGTHDRGSSDVVDALLTLGYSQKEARDVLAKIDPELIETNARVKEALRILSSERM